VVSTNALAWARADGVRLMRGKSVVELSVAEADKGTALLALARELGSDALVYLGDDVTDEHVFEAAGPGDVTIKVGEGDTAARHRVERCEDVPAVLALLRSLRSGG
ncbi:trehalose-phosphatase, partial [Salinibacter ruber]|uniref:trehalose-phosphatase n=1 Tax=Salinibacter ruber TaxID=146919 RepID=UPI0023430768